MKAHLAACFHRRYARRAQRQTQQYAVRRLFLQALFFAALVLVGLGLFHLNSAPKPPVISASLPFVQPETGRGAGNSAAGPSSPRTPTLCNPFDPNCYANAIGASTAQTILSGLQPITDFFQNSSTNILTQTPPDDSYHNTMVVTINQALVHAVDVALACLLLIGGYNVILGHHLRIEHSSITELLPRAILVTCAVHFNLLFLGLFIDLNNALCNTVVAAASAETLATIIGGFLSINPLAGLLLVVLILVVVIMLVLLLAQMITRIALVALLIAVAPLALACLALPQTMRWGRLWFTTFSAAVLVQFLQVTALALGGMLITSIGNTPIWHVGHALAEVFLAIGMMLITLKIPGMLQTWALHPMMQTSGGATGQAFGGGSGGGGDAASSAETTAKVAELLAML
jgi:hypothetical protein